MSPDAYFLCSLVFCCCLAICWIKYRQKAARARLLQISQQELRTSDRDWLEEHFKLFKHLPNPLKQRLEGLIHVFLDRISFEACGTLKDVTYEMQLLVAAQACLLYCGRPELELYPQLRSVLIYPGPFRASDPDDLNEMRLGESWETGSVVLSWISVKYGALRSKDGHNVTFHEFAHQLDQENDRTDGVPILDSRQAYAAWARDFRREWDALVEAVESEKQTFLDEYAATEPAEFFAVLVETFFEKPIPLQEKHPVLYQHLKRYFQLDPASWNEKSR